MQEAKPAIIVVDDDPNIVEMISDGLIDQGFEVISAANASQALKKIGEKTLQCALLDVDLGPQQINGIELGQQIKTLHPEIVTIIMTGYHNIKLAVEAMRRHSFHYLIKPFRIEQIVSLYERAQRELKLINENQTLKERNHFLEQEIMQLTALIKDSLPAERSSSLNVHEKTIKPSVRSEKVMQSYERQKQSVTSPSKKNNKVDET